jgi:hypothetical protein
METAAEYHQYARECLQWAAEAQTADQRKEFLSMARAWTEAALRVEGVLVPIEADKPASPTSPQQITQ